MTSTELSDIHHGGADTMAQAAKAQAQQKALTAKMKEAMKKD